MENRQTKRPSVKPPIKLTIKSPIRAPPRRPARSQVVNSSPNPTRQPIRQPIKKPPSPIANPTRHPIKQQPIKQQPIISHPEDEQTTEQPIVQPTQPMAPPPVRRMSKYERRAEMLASQRKTKPMPVPNINPREMPNGTSNEKKFNPELKYAAFNDPDKTPVFNRPMDTKEIEDFRDVLAKSYKRPSTDILWTNEIDSNTGKFTGNVIYYVKIIDKNTEQPAIDEESGEEKLRQIFTLNIKGRS